MAQHRSSLWAGAGLSVLCAATAALAQTPAFDRPGIAFSTTTIPAGSLAWEQGLPDIEYHSEAGERATLYSANTTIRVGLAERAELQIATALFNRLETDIRGEGSHADDGVGDAGLALKYALPSALADFSWAVLGGVGFPTGDDAFTADEHRYALGATLGYELNDSMAAAFYANAASGDGGTLWTVSPSLSFGLSDRLGVYVEAGASFGRDDEEAVVAGGGLTWMITPVLQFDISANAGLNDDAPDVAGGIGLSLFLE